MDEDPYTRDDLLTTAYVKSDGSFSANWVATYVDENITADVYAVFEGTEAYYRSTTCDTGITFDFGGSCSNTIQIVIQQPTQVPTPPTPPTPSSGGLVDDDGYVFKGDEYIEVNYAYPLSKQIHIGVSPSPDAYDDVKQYIVPSLEGVLRWTHVLENKFGGNWGFTYEVLEKNNPKWKAEPDIIINLITHEIDNACLTDLYGYIWPNYNDAVQSTSLN